MSKVNEVLHHRFRAHLRQPNHREPVIVTLRDGARPEQLQQAGMRIDAVMRNQPIVTGTIDVATLHSLSELDEVVRVEPDGSMHALGK